MRNALEGSPYIQFAQIPVLDLCGPGAHSMIGSPSRVDFIHLCLQAGCPAELFSSEFEMGFL